MDSDDPTQRILQRAKEREKFLQSLGSNADATENAPEPHTAKEDHPGVPAVKQCESPKKPLAMNNPAEPASDTREEHSGPRRSRFAALAERLDEFVCDMPSPKPKETFVKGPAKRVSMGGETRPAVLFAPTSHSSTPDKRSSRDSTSTAVSWRGSTSESESVKEAERSADSSKSRQLERVDEDEVFAASKGSPIRSFRNYKDTKDASLEDHLSLDDSRLSVASSDECGIHTFGRRVDEEKSTPSRASNLKSVAAANKSSQSLPEQRSQQKSPLPVKAFVELSTCGIASESFEYIDAASAAASPQLKPLTPRTVEVKSGNKQPSNLGTTPSKHVAAKEHTAFAVSSKTATYATPPLSALGKATESPASFYFTPQQTPLPAPGSASVKALRSRWELSSSTGTPLQPDTSQDELLQAAMSLSEKGNKPAKRNFVATTRLVFADDKAKKLSELRQDTQSPSCKTARMSRPASESAASEPSVGSVVEEDQINSTGFDRPSAEEMPEHVEDHVEKEDNEMEDQESTVMSPRKTIDEAFAFIKSPAPQGTENEQEPVVAEEPEDVPDSTTLRTPPPTSQPSLLDDITSDLEKYRTPLRTGVSRVADEEQETRSPQLAHTISFYRQHTSANRSTYYTPPTDPYDQLERSAQAEDSTATSSSGAVDTKETIKRIETAIRVQQDQIAQASRALALCRQSSMRGSPEEVDAHKALLIATERRRMLIFERDRLENQSNPSSSQGLPRGTLTITTVALKLSREFINMYVQRHQRLEGCVHYFIALVKCGENVLHTNLMSSDDSIKSGWVEFSHYMQLLGLPPDFCVTLEAYSLKTYRDSAGGSQSKKKGTLNLKKLMGTPKGANLSSVSSPGHLVAVDPSFQKLGSLVLNRSHVNRQKFLLSDVTGPLEGPVELRMRAFAEKSTTLSQRGFLSVYQVVENLGSWNRFWCVLRGPLLSCWKWPEDEDKKEPCLRLPLAKCVTPFTAVPQSVVSFQHAIEVQLNLSTQDGGSEVVRLMLAADTKADMDQWTSTLNKGIENANLWN